MSTITIEEAQEHLAQWIDKLAPGEEIVIMRDSVPVGKLVRVEAVKPKPIFGRGKGKLIIVAEDEEHLKDFEEYMQ